MKRLLIISWALLMFVACNRTTTETEKYEDGKIKVEKTYKKVNGEKELIKEVHYHPNGQKYIEGNYKDNKREGYWASWFENGQLWSEGEFRNGLSEGKRTVYHENGKVYYEGNFKDGERVGVWRFFNDAGVLTTETDYDTIPR
jgi:antitoxin component YwqK of YwqJK toxin-antitoxin module